MWLSSKLCRKSTQEAVLPDFVEGDVEKCALETGKRGQRRVEGFPKYNLPRSSREVACWCKQGQLLAIVMGVRIDDVQQR